MRDTRADSTPTHDERRAEGSAGKGTEGRSDDGLESGERRASAKSESGGVATPDARAEERAEEAGGAAAAAAAVVVVAENSPAETRSDVSRETNSRTSVVESGDTGGGGRVAQRCEQPASTSGRDGLVFSRVLDADEEEPLFDAEELSDPSDTECEVPNANDTVRGDFVTGFQGQAVAIPQDAGGEEEDDNNTPMGPQPQADHPLVVSAVPSWRDRMIQGFHQTRVRKRFNPKHTFRQSTRRLQQHLGVNTDSDARKNAQLMFGLHDTFMEMFPHLRVLRRNMGIHLREKGFDSEDDYLLHLLHIPPEERTIENINYLLLFMKNIKFFKSLPGDVVEALVRSMSVCTLPLNHFLFHERDEGDAFFIIIRGKVQVCRKIESKVTPPPTPRSPRAQRELDRELAHQWSLRWLQAYSVCERLGIESLDDVGADSGKLERQAAALLRAQQSAEEMLWRLRRRSPEAYDAHTALVRAREAQWAEQDMHRQRALAPQLSLSQKLAKGDAGRRVADIGASLELPAIGFELGRWFDMPETLHVEELLPAVEHNLTIARADRAEIKPILLEAVANYKVLAALHKGDSFGELALLSKNKRRHASVRIHEDQTVLSVVYSRDYDRILKTHMQQAQLRDARMLQQMRAFAHWSEAQLVRLLHGLVLVEASFGQKIMVQNEQVSDILIIKSGELKMSRRVADGSDMYLCTLGPLEIVGDHAVFEDAMPNALKFSNDALRSKHNRRGETVVMTATETVTVATEVALYWQMPAERVINGLDDLAFLEMRKQSAVKWKFRETRVNLALEAKQASQAEGKLPPLHDQQRRSQSVMRMRASPPKMPIRAKTDLDTLPPLHSSKNMWLGQGRRPEIPTLSKKYAFSRSARTQDSVSSTDVEKSKAARAQDGWVPAPRCANNTHSAQPDNCVVIRIPGQKPFSVKLR